MSMPCENRIVNGKDAFGDSYGVIERSAKTKYFFTQRMILWTTSMWACSHWRVCHHIIQSYKYTKTSDLSEIFINSQTFIHSSTLLPWGVVIREIPRVKIKSHIHVEYSYLWSNKQRLSPLDIRLCIAFARLWSWHNKTSKQYQQAQEWKW